MLGRLTVALLAPLSRRLRHTFGENIKIMTNHSRDRSPILNETDILGIVFALDGTVHCSPDSRPRHAVISHGNDAPRLLRYIPIDHL